MSRDQAEAAQDGRVRRTVPYIAAWFAAGVAAVVVAGAGVSFVTSQVTDSSRPAPLSADQVREELGSAAVDGTSTSTSTSTTLATSTSTTAPGGTTTVPTGSPTTVVSPNTTTPTTAPPPVGPAPSTRTYDLVGGTATLRFSSAGVTVVSATPAPGFSVDVNESHDNGRRVEFESDSHRSRVDAWWDAGPQDEVREDD